MRVTIIHEEKKSKRTVTFTGTNAMAEGMQYIYNQQPVKVLVVRVEQMDYQPKITKEMSKGFAWKA